MSIDSVKLDKSLIDISNTKKGYTAQKHISNLCSDLGFECITESVELIKQLNLISQLGIPYLQGYFSPAFPEEQIYEYTS